MDGVGIIRVRFQALAGINKRRIRTGNDKAKCLLATWPSDNFGVSSRRQMPGPRRRSTTRANAAGRLGLGICETVLKQAFVAHPNHAIASQWLSIRYSTAVAGRVPGFKALLAALRHVSEHPPA
jgi:hypothetical protein